MPPRPSQPQPAQRKSRTTITAAKSARLVRHATTTTSNNSSDSGFGDGFGTIGTLFAARQKKSKTKPPAAAAADNDSAAVNATTKNCQAASVAAIPKRKRTPGDGNAGPADLVIADAAAAAAAASASVAAAAVSVGDDESAMWVDKHQPKSPADLAVHYKRVCEVRQWLETVMTTHTPSRSGVSGHREDVPRVLLLTGPPGSGKTACVRALCSESGIEISEWINTVRERIYDLSVEGGREVYEGAMDRFRDFLLRSERYPTLSFGGTTCSKDGGDVSASTTAPPARKKIVLLEDLPNCLFYRDNLEVFHQLLRRCAIHARFPVVVIVSDVRGDMTSTSPARLFPRSFIDSGVVMNLAFNPVAITNLTKVLGRIAVKECHELRSVTAIPGQEAIKQLAETCGGDIRSAINTLQFACLRAHDGWERAETAGLVKRSAATGAGKKKRARRRDNKQRKPRKGVPMRPDELAGLGGRESSMQLFHAIGRILRPKRTALGPADAVTAGDNGSISSSGGDNSSSMMVVSDDEHTTLHAHGSLYLPPRLSHMARRPFERPNYAPEATLESARVSVPRFTALLHENYLDFFGNLEDVEQAAEYFSACDFGTLPGGAQDSDALAPYAATVICRGLVHANEHPAPASWRPMRRALETDANRLAQQRRESLMAAFCVSTPDGSYLPYPAAVHCAGTSRFTEVLPSLLQLNLGQQKAHGHHYYQQNYHHRQSSGGGGGSLQVGHRELLEQCYSFEGGGKANRRGLSVHEFGPRDADGEALPDIRTDEPLPVATPPPSAAAAAETAGRTTEIAAAMEQPSIAVEEIGEWTDSD